MKYLSVAFLFLLSGGCAAVNRAPQTPAVSDWIIEPAPMAPPSREPLPFTSGCSGGVCLFHGSPDHVDRVCRALYGGAASSMLSACFLPWANVAWTSSSDAISDNICSFASDPGKCLTDLFPAP